MILVRSLFISLCILVGFTSADATEVRILAWDDSVSARSLALIQGEKVTGISGLHPLKRSQSYSLGENMTQVIIRALDRPQEKGQPPVELRCAVNPNFLQPLLILLPDPTAPSGLRGIVIEDDVSSFPWGTMRFLNVSSKEVAVRVEKKSVRLPIGGKPVDIAPGGHTRNVGVLMALTETLQEPAYTAVWEHRDDARSLIFILSGGDSRLGSLLVKTIPEVRGTAEEEAPTKKE